MKNIKNIKRFALLGALAVSGILVSCSDDDDNGGTIESGTTTRLYTSNNANGNITYYDLTDMANVQATTLVTASLAADGVYYDASTDAVIQASRSGLFLEGFTNISGLASGTTVNQTITGAADMTSPREVAVNGNFYVVADNSDVDSDDSTNDGRLFVYQRSGGSFTLRNIITTDFKVWGITFSGNDLYAIVDTTNELAVYSNFLSNTADATLSASKTIAVEGIVRTHGITYDTSSNVMILTDIGDAGSPSDGGFHVISDFSTKFNATTDGGTLVLAEQVRVAGSNTNLGNPVDVAYDSDTETVFIAEAANGSILAFNNIGNGGNLTPAMNNSLASASAVYLSKN
ncbi:hypothetical protein ACWGOQ_0019935 [Aquimarina sp. M1]